MAIKAEKNSKAELSAAYNVSRNTIWRWLRFLSDNYEALAVRRNDQDYLCFDGYNRHSKMLTPKQITTFKKHYGEP